jgi:tight adherence protein B
VTVIFARFRVGARVRRLSRRRSRWDRFALRIATLLRLPHAGEDEPARWVRRLLASASAGAAAGVIALGWAGAMIGMIVGACVPVVGVRRRASRRAAEMERQLPDVLRSMSAALRAGQSVVQALGTAAADARLPIRALLGAAVGRIAAGSSVDESLSALEASCPAPSMGVAVAALRIGRASGGNLPLILDATAEAILDRARLLEERRAATAQARLSATVVAAMPLVFLLMLGTTARNQLRDAFAQPAGLVLFGIGLALEAAGIVWLRRVLEPRW